MGHEAGRHEEKGAAAGGSKYAAAAGQFGASDYAGDAEQQIKTMIQALVQRGIDDGTFRGDLSVGELLFLLGSLLPAAARMTAEHQAGVEKAALLITSVFLHGTENRQGATAGDRAIRRHAEPDRKSTATRKTAIPRTRPRARHLQNNMPGCQAPLQGAGAEPPHAQPPDASPPERADTPYRQLSSGPPRSAGRPLGWRQERAVRGTMSPAAGDRR